MNLAGRATGLLFIMAHIIIIKTSSIHYTQTHRLHVNTWVGLSSTHLPHRCRHCSLADTCTRTSRQCPRTSRHVDKGCCSSSRRSRRTFRWTPSGTRSGTCSLLPRTYRRFGRGRYCIPIFLKVHWTKVISVALPGECVHSYCPMLNVIISMEINIHYLLHYMIKCTAHELLHTGTDKRPEPAAITRGKLTNN